MSFSASSTGTTCLQKLHAKRQILAEFQRKSTPKSLKHLLFWASRGVPGGSGASWAAWGRGPGAFRAHLGAFRGCLGAALGRLGAVLGPSWGAPGASWAVLGAPWARLGASRGDLGRSWARLGALFGRLGRDCRESTKTHKNPRKFKDFWGPGGILGRLGGVLERLGRVLGASCGVLGASWGRL